MSVSKLRACACRAGGEPSYRYLPAVPQRQERRSSLLSQFPVFPREFFFPPRRPTRTRTRTKTEEIAIICLQPVLRRNVDQHFFTDHHRCFYWVQHHIHAVSVQHFRNGLEFQSSVSSTPNTDVILERRCLINHHVDISHYPSVFRYPLPHSSRIIMVEWPLCIQPYLCRAVKKKRKHNAQTLVQAIFARR